MKIAVNNPGFLMAEDPVFMFHGYSLYFVLNHADYLYVQNPERMERFRERLKELDCKRDIRFLSSTQELNREADVLVSFHIPKQNYGLDEFTGMTVVHTMDHHVNTKYVYQRLLELKADFVASHSQVDERCEFFRHYYPFFVGKVINVPFGYAPRFKVTKPFTERINKAVGLGSINMIRDAMLTEEESREMVEFFADRKWMHPIRKYVQDHAEELSDCVDALFPTPEKQKDFSYDAVERLNSYRMFVNDAGIQEFPPARTYEGIACGCVMVATDDPIYIDIGFEKDVNCISFREGDYGEMAEKIRFYMAHEDELQKIQIRSLELAKGLTQEKAAEIMYQGIEKRFRERNV